MPEEVNCNLCGSDDAGLLYKLRDYRLEVDDHQWNVVRCRSCGLGYLNPRPTVDEIGRYYPRRYFSHRGFQMQRYRRFARYILGPPGRLLDIGTAQGDFLLVMRELGWDVSGIEPAEEAGNPYDLPIYRMHFSAGSYIPLAGNYDVITAWAVFEHLHDPFGAFEMCARLLRPGGSFVVQVPNLQSLHSRWARQEDVPRHLYFFSSKTLRAYATRVGLELDYVSHTTDLFGGSGRGVLRLGLVRLLGRSTDDFFEVWRTPRRERFRRWPLLAVVWTGVALIERVLLADWVIRTARISGQIVAVFHKPAADVAA